MTEIKYWIDPYGWKRIEQLDWVYGESSENESVGLFFDECSIHGLQPHIGISCQGGHDGTMFCLGCAKALEEQMTDEWREAAIELRRLNKERAKLQRSERDEWDKKNNYAIGE